MVPVAVLAGSRQWGFKDAEEGIILSARLSSLTSHPVRLRHAGV